MQIKLYYYWQQYDWQDEGQIVVSSVKMAHDTSYCLIQELDVDVPDCTAPTREVVVAHKTEKLNELKQVIQAEAHQRLAVIDDKIAQLQSITYKGDV